ncbi:fatty-acyl coenzyme A oxidase [Entomophthora muscae]|uniref:Fatty-acyl coenzyme A oxidase n=1 Tax=Entomophthora muscae TaxID=34485 RepID=A0ACC2SAP5_9FUNG|nr:fatty-acyl coenzyme A oxidase [Entomophthora muscae]
MSNKAQRRLNQIKNQVDSLPSPSESLNDERLNPSFPVDEMTHFLNGGKRITELKNKFIASI